MVKKALSVFLATLTLVGLTLGSLSTAASGERPFEGVTLNVILEGHPSSNAIKALTPEFEELTGIKVNVEVIPYDELPQKVLLAFSQGSDSYDIIHNDKLYTAGYVENDYVLPLDGFVTNDAINQYYDAADLVPAYLDACYLNGKQYSLPVYGESTFLMYRKDLFEEYGIEVPGTMDELIAAAQKVYEVTNGEVAGITLRGAAGIHVIYAWCGFLWAYGGQWLDENGKLDLDTPEAIAATEAFISLLRNYGPMGYANFGWQENRLVFQQGQAAMTIDATVNGAFCEDPAESSIVGKVGYAPVPSGSENQKGGQHSLAVHSLFISKFSKNPEAAFLFASWALSKDIQIRSMEIEAHSGVSSLAAMESPQFAEKYGAFTEGMLNALAQANSDYLINIPEASEIIDRVGRAITEALAGSKTAEDALVGVTNDINTNVLK